jgi:hypothetical protein
VSSGEPRVKVEVEGGYESLSRAAARMVVAQLQTKPDSVILLPTTACCDEDGLHGIMDR